MKQLSAFLPGLEPVKKSRKTERGELLKYFSQKTGWTIPRLCGKLVGLEVKDFYYIKSICDDYERRGGVWAKCFFGSLKV